MNTEIYILIGISIFAFLIGHKLRQHLKKTQPKVVSNKKGKGKKQTEKTISPSKSKEKLKRVFVYIQLLLVFSLLVFMIPALSRDLLTNQTEYDEKLILRIIIVVFSVYILFMGFLKVMKANNKGEK